VAGAAPDGKFCSESINGWPLLSLMKQGVNDRYGRFRAGAGPRGMSASGTSQPAEQRPPWVETGHRAWPLIAMSPSLMLRFVVESESA
jgi:hypothetical protein